MTRVHTTYNQLAGKNFERLAALSDSIFAVAMTLLVLDLHVPDVTKIATERDLLFTVSALLPRLITYLMSFLTLGIFWIGQQTMLNHIERSNRHFAWINLAFLSLVTLIPFSTSFLATFITFRSALLIYWANIFLLGVSVLVAWLYARNVHLIRPDIVHALNRAFLIRICSSQAFYAGATLLGLVFNTYVTIGLIVLIQLNYAFAPKLLFRSETRSRV